MSDQQPIQTITTIKQNDEIIAANIDDEVVIMQTEESKYYGLDPIASDIWQMMVEPQKVSQICYKLLEKYETDAASCETDVLNHLNSMHADGLVKIVK